MTMTLAHADLVYVDEKKMLRKATAEIRKAIRKKARRGQGIDGDLAPLADGKKAKLKRTGALLKSLRWRQRTVDKKRGIYRSVLGVKNEDYPRAAALHYGSKKRGLPARPWMGIADDDADKIFADVLADPPVKKVKVK